LNKSYRGKDKATNVLSFINDDEPLGDIILAYETIEREAIEQEKSFRDHTIHLIIHGILHLMGHDHEVPEEAAKMEAKEIKILKKLGIENPYL
jgi:probable rRNA maturation factor